MVRFSVFMNIKFIMNIKLIIHVYLIRIIHRIFLFSTFFIFARQGLQIHSPPFMERRGTDRNPYSFIEDAPSYRHSENVPKRKYPCTIILTIFFSQFMLMNLIEDSFKNLNNEINKYMKACLVGIVLKLTVKLY